MSTRTKIFLAVAALAVLVLALSRGGAPSEQLRQLEDDPMASYVPARGSLIDSASRNEGMSLGRPVQAQVTRLFQLPTGGGPRALAQARAEAESDGWRASGRTGERAFVAEKTLADGRAELVISLIDDARLLPDTARPPGLSVSLQHLGS